jgi:hypothetical protein
MCSEIDNHVLLQVGTLNRSGRKYIGHFDIPLKNCVASLLDFLTLQNTFNNERPINRGGWVNGNDYQDAGETFGILRFDATVCETYCMLPYDSQTAHEMATCHQWLSDRQGTLFAVVPVHTREEQDIFSLLMETSKAFTGRAEPNWVHLASEWSSHCNGKTVFYKVSFLHNTHRLEINDVP